MQIHNDMGARTAIAEFTGVAACMLASALLSFSAVAVAQGAQSARSAQSAQLDARWQPWIGCWQPVAQQRSAITFSSPRSAAALVCISPATDVSRPSTIDVLTVADGKIATRDSIDASGRAVARTKDGCTGVEKAIWSEDGHRLFTTSDFTCPGGIKRTSSGIFAMSPDGEWSNVQGVKTGGTDGIRTLRYSDAGTPSTLPAEISQAIAGRSLAVSTARAAAAASLTKGNVIEASRRVDPAVVQGWILDRGQSFGLDANAILALANAGVPGAVTDAMVAVSYPKAFAVNGESNLSGVAGSTSVEGTQDDIQRSSGRDIRVMMMPSYAPFGYSPFGYSPFDYYGYGYSPYGYSPNGYSPYGYSPLGYSPYGGFYSPYAGYGLYGGRYAPPVIILKGTETPPQRGYAVKGGGYSQTAPRSGGNSGSTAQPRPAVSPPPSQGNAAPPEPPSSGRTAHKRP